MSRTTTFRCKNKGVPKKIREQLGFAADAINAHERGLSVPEVALNYRYEPISAMSMIATCCREYGYTSVAQHVPAHIMSLVEAEHPACAIEKLTAPERPEEQ